MAVRDSRELVIEATPQEILDVLTDVDSSPDWCPQFRSVEVLESYRDGRAKRVMISAGAAGMADDCEFEYVWGDNTVVTTMVQSRLLKAQKTAYTLTPVGDKTKVRYDLEIDPAIPIPGFLLKRTLKGAMETATDGLRKHVLKLQKG